jgi:hypothetical protein
MPSKTRTRASKAAKARQDSVFSTPDEEHFKRREKALANSTIGRVKAVKEALDRTMTPNRFEPNRSPKISSSKSKGTVLSSQMTEQHNNWHPDAEVPDNVAALYTKADAANANNIGNMDNIGLKHFTSTRTTESPELRSCTLLDSKRKWKRQINYFL